MRMLGMVAVAAALFVFAALAAACDDDGTALSLEEYFTQLDEAQNEVDRQFDEAFQADEPDPDSTGEEIAAYVLGFVQTFATILEDAEGTFDELKPPAEAEDAHASLVEAIGDTRVALEGAEDEIPDALSLEELETFDPFAGADDPSQRIEEACIALQTIADDNSIAVDLECQE